MLINHLGFVYIFYILREFNDICYVKEQKKNHYFQKLKEIKRNKMSLNREYTIMTRLFPLKIPLGIFDGKYYSLHKYIY